MPLIFLPRNLVVDVNGVPRVGAKLYVYDAGTTTPRVTYPTAADAEAETNQQTHPLASNSSGQFAPAYIREVDGDYKILLTDADDVPLSGYPVDNIPVLPFDQDLIGQTLYPRTAAEISAGVTPVDYAYPPSHPLRYGATGDGATNDDAAFAALEDAYTGVMVDLGGLEYAVTTTLPAANIYYNGTFTITSDDAPLNTAFGYEAFRNNAFTPFEFPSSTLDFAGGNYNTAFGSYAMHGNTHGRRNTAIGAEALRTGSTAYYNTAIGALALRNATTAGENVAVGVQCMQECTTGLENVAVGSAALLANTTGDYNVAIGRQALLAATTCNGNTAIGRRAMLAITTGEGNTAVGQDALSGNVTGVNNTIVGDIAAGAAANFARVVAVGRRAASANTANDTTAIGTDSLISNTSGTGNVAVGYSAAASVVTGINNTAVGHQALPLSTGDHNTAIGKDSLASATTGDLNTAIGYSALSSLTTSDNCVGLGYNAQVTGSNQVQLGGSGTTTYAYGAVQDRSDARDKADIRDTVLDLAFLKKLRAVDYRWDYREDYGWGEKDGSRTRARFHHGFIAQEVRAAMDELGVDFGGFQDHSISGGKDVLSIGYTELIPIIIKAIQQLDGRLGDLEAA